MDTYNTLINYIEFYFARPHQQILSFGEGFYEDATPFYSDEIGGMYVVLTDVQHLQNSVSQYNLRCYFIDLLRNDDDNQREVISDQIQISRDFVNWLRNDKTGGAQHLYLLNDPTAFPVRSLFMDYTAGCYIDVSIEVETEMTDCTIPFEGYSNPAFNDPTYVNIQP